MRLLKFTFLLFIAVSCSDNDDSFLENTLAFYINNQTFEMGAVISCAASTANSNEVLVFFYPENKAIDIRFYETSNLDVDENDFSLYEKVVINSKPFFNGYLGKFQKDFPEENWVIVTFELDGEIKLSNPIRIKHITKPTVWTNEVVINQDQSTMPEFTWTANANGENAIYFEVVSDAVNNLLSGTYTYENHFQYYNTSNIVLNITTQIPPNLSINENYNFTMMDVSIDNWVNTVIEKPFIAK